MWEKLWLAVAATILINILWSIGGNSTTQPKMLQEGQTHPLASHSG